jgi:hypothetical protein
VPRLALLSNVRVALAVLFSLVFVFPVDGQTPAELDISPTKLAEKKNVKLPGTISEVKVGGDGRFLLLHFKDLRKIGLLDLNAGEVVHYFPANDDDTVFDASISKLVIASGSKGVIARYDLLSHERELVQTIDSSIISHLLIGSATEGPIYLGGGSRGYDGRCIQVDMQTLKTSEFEMEGRSSRGFGPSGRVRLSANGRTFSQWATGVSPSGLQSIVKSGDSWKGFYEHDSVGHILPSADGRILYTGAGIYTDQLRVKGKIDRSQLPLPAVHGDYYLNVTREDDRTSDVTLHLAGESRPLVKIPSLSFKTPERGNRTGLPIDKRLILIPRADLIVHIPTTADSLTLHPFNLKEALDNSGIDYLFVQSRAPLKASPNEAFDYQLDVLSKSGKLSYKLDSAPQDMKISTDGKVTWQPTTNSAPENNVIITIADGAGQEVFHSFNLKVPGGKGSAKAQTTSSSTAKLMDSTNEPIRSVEMTEESQDIKLPAPATGVVHGGAGRYMLLHFESLKKVGLFDIESKRITHYFPAADDDTQIAAGLNHLLIASPNQGVIARYNLKTFERELTQAIPFTGKVQFMAMGSGSMGPAMVRVADGSSALDSCHFEFLDLKTLDRVAVDWQQKPHSVYRDFNLIRASSIGGKFTLMGIGPVAFNANQIKYSYQHDQSGGIPSFDGSYYIGYNQIFNADMKPLGEPRNRNQGNTSVPAVMGNYYLNYAVERSFGSRNSVKKKVSAKLFMFGDDRPLVTLTGMEPPMIRDGNGYQNREIPADRRVMFVPRANVIVTLAETNDRLVLRRMNIDEALDESGVDYLIVMSTAPATGQLGENYKYQLDVKSKKGGLKFKVESGPEGMTISDKGTVNWLVPQNPDLADHKIIVSTKDSADQEVFHTFSIELPELAEKKRAEALLAVKQREANERSRLEKMRAEQEKRREESQQRSRDRELRMIQQRAELERQAALARQNRSRPVEKSSTAIFEFRDWTDSTGKHTMRAKFMRIDDKKTVVLFNDSGKELQVPLQKLSNADIYEAVQNDLMRLGQVSNDDAETGSPFKSIK